MKDGIKIIVTKNGKTKTTTMDVAKWLETRFAHYAVNPLDSVTYGMFREINTK